MAASFWLRWLRPLITGWLMAGVVVLAQGECACAGRTFFVAPEGHDTNSGLTAEQPWASLHQAAAAVGPGDIVSVASGTYRLTEALVISAAGTRERPIFFKGTGATRPLLDCTAIAVDSTRRRRAAVVFGPEAQHVVFENFEVANAADNGVRADGTFITIRQCLVRDVQRVAISLGGDDNLAEDNEVFNACLMAVGSNEWPGEWPQAVNSGGRPAVAPATVGDLSRNNVFRRNYIHDSWGEGIDAIYSDGVIIEDNVIHDVMSVGVYIDHSRNVIIRGNSIYTTNDVRGRGKERRPMTGILLGAEYLSLFVNNPPHSHVENVEIYNNVCVRVGHGIGQWLDHQNTDNKNIYENVRIYHNTVDTKDGAWAPIWFARDLKFPTRGNECKNNLLRGSRELSAAAGFVFENNLWVNGVPSAGEHRHSLTGDPGWVAPGATPSMEGYRLKPGSPAIGRAQPIGGLTTDKGGQRRAWPADLGAWETGQPLAGARSHGDQRADDGGKPAGEAPAEFASALQLKLPLPPRTFVPGVNVVKNHSFEAEPPAAGTLPEAWNAEGDVAVLRVVSPGFKGLYPGPETPEGQALQLEHDGPFRVTVSQDFDGLPNGRYGLQVRVRRFGNEGTFWAESETGTGERVRTDIPPREKLLHHLADYEDPTRYVKRWLQLTQSDIEVKDGRCTIRFHGEGGKGDRLLIDDVVFFRY